MTEQNAAPVAQPTPPVASAPAPKKGLAVTALVLGIVAILGSWIPFLSIGSVLIGLVGLVFGVIAMVKAFKGTAGGKVMAIVGAALSGLAIVFGIVSTSAGTVAVDNAIDEAIEEQESDFAAEDVEATDSEEEEPASDNEAVAASFEPLVVVDKQVWSGDSDYWSYFILIENPSNEAFYHGLDQFTIEILDADGTILASENTYPTVAPGTEVGLTGIFFDSETLDAADVDRVEVFVPEEPTSTVGEGEIGSMTITGVEATSDSYSVTVTGTVESAFAEDQESVAVNVVAFDGEGTVVDESSTLLDRLPSGGATRFEVGLYDIDSADGLTFKAWAYPLY